MKSTASESKHPPRSIAWKVCLFVTVLLVAVTLVITLVGFLAGRQIVRQQVHERLRVVASARHHLLSEYIARQRLRIEQYADRNRLQRAVRGYADQPAEQAALIERMLTESKEQFYGIVEAWLTDAQGRVIATTDPAMLERDFSEDESFRHGLREPFVSAPAESGDKLVAHLTAPIVDESGTPAGVLFVLHDMTPLRQIAGDHQGLGSSGDILVASLRNDQLDYFFPSALPRPTSIAEAPVLRMAIKGQSNLDAVQTRWGSEEVLATYQPIDLQPGVRSWAMVTKINVDEAYAPVYRLARLLFLSQAILLVLVWTATQWLARRFTVPLDRLTHVVSQFASGQRDARADVQSNDEIAALAEAFNQMADAVSRTENELEHRVRKRTGELQKEIDTRKAIQRQLTVARDTAEKANRSKSQFLANMSHEIRTPMNGILGMAQLLESSDLKPEQQSQLITMQQCAQWLLQLLNDILDYSKIEAGMLSLEKVPFDLRDCVDSTVTTLAARGYDRDIELVCRIAPEVPARMVSDPGRLRQILFNLIGNALKFTSRGHVTVEITAREVEYAKVNLKIVVRDSGIGIAPENQAHIFEAFRQADSSTTREFGGTGLGLSISAQLIGAMDGTIELQSELGAGSMFHVELPMRFLPPPADNAEPVGHSELCVLLVDSHAKSRSVVGEMVRSWGFSVVEAGSGSEALQLLKSQALSLVLLDSALPDLSPEQWVSRMRETAGCRTLPIVVMDDVLTAAETEWRDEADVGRLNKPIGHRPLRNILMYKLLGIQPPPRDAAAKTTIDTSTGQPLRVLLVEDSLVNQQVALGLLRRLKCEVDVATHGGEAIKQVAENQYDVVLMDVQMPIIDGIKATIAIRRAEAGTKRRLPIVAMTAAAMKGDRQRCFDAGMDGYISKPVTQENLVLELSRVLSGNDGHGDPNDSRIWVQAKPLVPVAAAPSRSRQSTVRATAAVPNPARNTGHESDEVRHAGLDQLCLDFSEQDALVIANALVIEATQLMDSLRESADRVDLSALTRGAHTLKGSARVAGFDEVVELSAQIEQLARKGKTAEAVSQIDRLAELTAAMIEVAGRWIDCKTAVS